MQHDYAFVTTEITSFIADTFKKTGKKKCVIAVSGGIDSAVSLTLACKALGAKNVYPLMLPYNSQSIGDSQKIIEWNDVPPDNVVTQNIFPIIDATTEVLGLELDDEKVPIRLGNLMARARMMLLYDRARELDALVCGTENKSEKYLGYFTRFGDEASDLEPLIGLYKTEVRELAQHLEIPKVFLEKAPSAGLWKGQTDEEELGFSYQTADAVLTALVDAEGGRRYLQLVEGGRVKEVTKELLDELPDLTKKQVSAVLARVQTQQFKHEVPYTSY